MSIASFFSGIDGLSLGLEAAGLGPVVFQCEKDPFARSVLERHWPGVPRAEDITELRAGEIPSAEVWCGGFPCTDLSVAGKGAGIHDGEHSSLWWDWYGLIREVRPRVVVVENVSAFLGRGLLDVLGAFAEVGYDAEWHSLSAADVGAPHLRKRVFVIAWLPDTGGDAVRVEPGRIERAGGAACAAEPGHDGAEGAVADAQDLSERAGLREDGAGTERGRRSGDGGREGEAGPDAGRELLEGREPAGATDGPVDGGDAERGAAQSGVRRVADELPAGLDDPWAAGEWPGVPRVATGVPDRVARLRCLGNAVVPACAEVIGRRVRQILLEHGGAGR